MRRKARWRKSTKTSATPRCQDAKTIKRWSVRRRRKTSPARVVKSSMEDNKPRLTGRLLGNGYKHFMTVSVMRVTCQAGGSGNGSEDSLRG